jgi:hypothetical protein
LRLEIIEDITSKFGSEFNWKKDGNQWMSEANWQNNQNKRFFPVFIRNDRYLLNLQMVPAFETGYGEECGEEYGEYYEGMTDNFVEVDILVAFDLEQYLDTTTPSVIYEFFRRQESPIKFAHEMSTSLASYQKQFVNGRLNKNNNILLKNYILLAKYWLKNTVKKEFTWLRCPSYLVELLCLKVWEKLQSGVNIVPFEPS